MIDQLFQIIQTAATSPVGAIMVSLAFNIALGWGWWRREVAHMARYDKLHSEWIDREKSYFESVSEHDKEISELAREAFSAMSDTATALVGMERTLDGIEILLRK